jgi:phosphoglycolate phosphatase-like HAD superfamily hydrolase
MNACMAEAFRKEGLPYSLEDREAWQIYGLFSADGYVGFMRAGLALSRAGKRLADYLTEKDIAGAIGEDVSRQCASEDEGLLLRMAKAAEERYNADPSRRIQEDAMEALGLLKSHNVPLSCVTDTYTESASNWLAKNVPGIFEAGYVFGKEPGATVAPDHKMRKLLAASEKMNLFPDRTVYVADTRCDILAARKGGCAVGVVLNGMGFHESWRDMPPDYEFENLLAAARFIVS